MRPEPSDVADALAAAQATIQHATALLAFALMALVIVVAIDMLIEVYCNAPKD